MNLNKERISRKTILTRKIRMIEKEQDKEGIIGMNYSRENRIFGKDWKEAKLELEKLKEIK